MCEDLAAKPQIILKSNHIFMQCNTTGNKYIKISLLVNRKTQNHNPILPHTPTWAKMIDWS